MTLAPHRPSRLEHPDHDGYVNVGNTERKYSIGGGAALALYGLTRKSLGGVALAAIGGGLLCRGVSGHCPAYQATGTNTTGDGAQPQEYSHRGIHVVQVFSINKTPTELYTYWRDFRNLPRFMTHLKEVRVTGEKTSHWTANGAAGYSVEWDAEIISDECDSLIAWRSLGGADVDNAGSVRFSPIANREGSEVKVTLDYIPPGGKVGAAVAWLFGSSGEQQVRDDLRHFKQVMEAGEIPTIQGQPKGNCGNPLRSKRS